MSLACAADFVLAADSARFRMAYTRIGLSVDGPKRMHDAYRIKRGGEGSFDQVMRGREMLRRRDVDVNVLCTIHAANADQPVEVYRFFRDELQTKFMQFIPIVERTTENFLPLANLGWGERPGLDRPLIRGRSIPLVRESAPI